MPDVAQPLFRRLRKTAATPAFGCARDPHDQAPSYTDTNWSEVVALHNALDRIAPNLIVTVNRAVAVAMMDGPRPGLAVLDSVHDAFHEHHRYHAVRAHLLEHAGRAAEALDEYDLALQHVTNERERDHLQLRRAALRSRTSDIGTTTSG